MRGRTPLLAALAVSTSLFVAACPGGSSNDNANTNGNDNSASFEQSVVVDLSTNGEFDLSGQGPVERTFSASISDALGISTLDAFAVSLDPADVELAAAGTSDIDTNGIGSNGVDSNGIDTNGISTNGPSAEASATLDVLIGVANDENVCASGLSLGRFEIVLNSNGSVAVEPSRLSANATALGLVEGGEFEVCLRADSESAATLTLDGLTFLLNTTAPDLDCSQILALAEVQDALDTLADEGLSFDLRRGTDPRNITGAYTVNHAVEFDPDGADESELPSRTDLFSGQADGTVTRSTGRVELDQFIIGTDDGVSLCVLARTNDPDCDQLIARMESYDVGSNGQDLEGSFLAVVIERHESQLDECGQAGDFIFGRITLTSQSSTDGTPSNDNTPPDEPPDPVDEVPPDPVDEVPDPVDEEPLDPVDGPPDPLDDTSNPDSGG